MAKARLGWILFIMYVLFLLWLTVLSRKPRLLDRVFKWELLWSYRAWLAGESFGKTESIQNLKNILAFIPFGFLYPQRENILRVVCSAAILACFIEAVQYVWNLGWCEIDDVISNTLGSLIGYGLWIGIRKIQGKIDAN